MKIVEPDIVTDDLREERLRNVLDGHVEERDILDTQISHDYVVPNMLECLSLLRHSAIPLPLPTIEIPPGTVVQLVYFRPINLPGQLAPMFEIRYESLMPLTDPWITGELSDWSRAFSYSISHKLFVALSEIQPENLHLDESQQKFYFGFIVDRNKVPGLVLTAMPDLPDLPDL